MLQRVARHISYNLPFKFEALKRNEMRSKEMKMGCDGGGKMTAVQTTLEGGGQKAPAARPE